MNRPAGFLLALCLLPGIALGAVPAPGDFAACVDASGRTKQQALYGVHLGADILERCSAGCADLRLFGPEGQETPFVVIENVAPPEPQEKYPLEVTDYAPSGTEAVITLKMPERHRAVTVLEIHTPDRDFKKRVELGVSRDARTWRKIATDAIYDFSSRVDLRKTRIEFPAARERYFRLKLTDDGEKPKPGQAIRLRYEGLDFSVEGMARKELKIQGVHALTGLYRERVPVTDTRTFPDPAATTDKQGNTVIVLKAGLPLERLSFAVATPYYSRNVVVSSRAGADDDTDRFLTRGTIYRFTLDGRNEEQTFVDARAPKQESYTIVIENRGNAPLAVKAVDLSWVRQNLYFVAPADGDRYRLCFGNDTLSRPEYDLSRFITRDNLARHAPVFLATGTVQVNAAYAPKAPKQKRARIERLVLTAVVVVLVIVLGSWLYSLVRKMAQEKQP